MGIGDFFGRIGDNISNAPPDAWFTLREIEESTEIDHKTLSGRVALLVADGFVSRGRLYVEGESGRPRYLYRIARKP